MKTNNRGVSRTFSCEILVAASVECSSRILEQDISLLRFASPAHKMVTSMPLMSKSGQIMHRHSIIQRDYG